MRYTTHNKMPRNAAPIERLHRGLTPTIIVANCLAKASLEAIVGRTGSVKAASSP